MLTITVAIYQAPLGTRHSVTVVYPLPYLTLWQLCEVGMTNSGFLNEDNKALEGSVMFLQWQSSNEQGWNKNRSGPAFENHTEGSSKAHFPFSG